MELNFYTEKLKTAFEDTRKSKQNIADMIGVSVRTINYWCSGRSLPNIMELHKIAEVTGKTVPWFYGIESTADTKLLDEIKAERDDWRDQAKFLREMLQAKTSSRK